MGVIKRRAFFIYNTAFYLHRFRQQLIERVRDEGYQPVAVVPYNKDDWDQLTRLGVELIHLPIVDQRLSPLADIRMMLYLYRLFKKYRPGFVFSFTAKPVIFGSLAAHYAGVPAIASMIVGLGILYSRDTVRAKLARFLLNALYRIALPKNDCVFFQNGDDLELFTKTKRFAPPSRAHLVNGSGVSLVQFSYKEPRPQGNVTFLCATRRIREKGIREFVEAAIRVSGETKSARFRLVAPRDNLPNTLADSELDALLAGTPVEYVQEKVDMVQELHNADVFVLPSYYREGIPRVVLEAMACGRAIITTDMPGCRETVSQGTNGFLVPPRDSVALANAMMEFTQKPALCREMGKQSRVIAEQRFDVHQVTQQILDGLRSHLPSPKPRILYAVTNADLAGAPIHVFALLSNFRSQFDVHCVTGERGPVLTTMKQIGVEVSVIPELRSSINVYMDVVSIFRFVDVINRFRPDIIHAHSSKAGFIARIAGGLTNTPAIFTAHGWGFTPGTPLPQRLLVWFTEAFTTPLSRAIVCVSDFDRRLGTNWLPFASNRLRTILNGVPDTSRVADPGKNPVRITMIARVSTQKNHSLAIRAFANVKSDSAILCFVGEGTSYPDFLPLLRDLPGHVRRRIECLGIRRNIDEILENSQALALFSHYEGLPLTIIEGLRAGLPIVATNVGGVQELVVHGHNGLLVPPNDVEAATQALQLIVDNAALRVTFGSRGRHRYESDFREESMLIRTKSLYREILTPKFATS
jgi:glycosyltransferase involved in cell wall biosynthesis